MVSHRELITHLQSQKTALLLELVEGRFQEEASGGAATEELARWQEIRRSMRGLGASIILPFLVSGEEVAGFLTLDDARVSESFSADELALLMQIAEQAGVTLENYRLFERMKERDRLAALGEMAAGLAHEIRNPLGAIKGAAQYLDPASLPPEDGEFLGIIIEEVDRLNRVLTQFLDYSRPWKGQMEPVSVNHVAEHTARVVSAQLGPGIEVGLDLCREPLEVTGDEGQLGQVLMNLVLNAAQAMPGGGRVTIRTWMTHPALDRLGAIGDLILRGLGRTPLVHLSVTDTGAGIPAENLRRIFIPFFTSKKGGTGLGLAICQKLIENHGGGIEVQSEQGRGSTFTVKLPVVARDRGREDSPAAGTKD